MKRLWAVILAVLLVLSTPGSSDAAKKPIKKSVKVAVAAKPKPAPLLTADQIRAACMPSVVVVQATSSKSTMCGSGFFYGGPGLIATCRHVIKDRDRIQIKDNQGRWYDASVFAVSKDTDAAILEVNDWQDRHKELPVRLFDQVVKWERVYALGNPQGSEFVVSPEGGIYLKDDDTKTKFLFHTADAIPGYSGGPLISKTDGKVIGMVNTGGTAVAIDDINKLLP